MSEDKPRPQADFSPEIVRTPNMIPSCPICGAPMTGRQTFCSGKCRIARSLQRREEKQVAKSVRLQLLIQTVMTASSEAKILEESS